MQNIWGGLIVLSLLFCLFIFCLGLYFLPTIIAAVRGNINILAIFLLNFFTGWTFVGWIASLIWAVII